MMSEKRFERWNDHCCKVKDNQEGILLRWEDVVKKLNEYQSTIDKLEQRDYYNQSERYKILGRAIELASDYIHTNDLEYYDFCGLVTEFEEELLEDKEIVMSEK